MTKKLIYDKIDKIHEGCKYPTPVSVIDYSSEEPQMCLSDKIVVINFDESNRKYLSPYAEIFLVSKEEDLNRPEFEHFIRSIGFVEE
jgi:hypothetical protein